MSEIINSKEIVAIASPYIKSIIDDYVKPKIKNLFARIQIEYNKNVLPTESHFSEYFHRTYKKISVLNTLVFNNSQKLLKDVYIPLTITHSNSINQAKKKYKIDTFPEQLFNHAERILITDSAGMGKSTLIKKMFIDIIEKKVGIPIIVELRRLSKNKTVIAEINEQLNSINKNFDTTLLLELLSEGDFIILLDGYDEIVLSDKDVVTKDLQDFISKVSTNKFILTSRPENTLASFGDFEKFVIEPLKKKEAHELLRKYDNGGNISSLLIKKLEEKEMASVDEFLVNPLLVSLLFTAFHYKQAIPFKKYLFYRQVYDANFENHDLTKGESYTHEKHSKLVIDDFHKVLRHLGYSCMKDQKIEFDKDELLKRIQESKDFYTNLEFNPSDFLTDLISTVPLFTQDGNYYRWSHKSLQEYFAAQFIYTDSKGVQAIILEKIYEHLNIEKFINVLDLYYDIDFKTFRNVIMRKLLNEYKAHFDSYLQTYDSSIDEKEIKFRRELCFFNEPNLFKFSNPFGEGADKEFDEFLKKHFNNAPLSFAISFSPGTHCINRINRKIYLLRLIYNKGFDGIEIHKRELQAEPNVNHLIDEALFPYSVSDKPESKFNSSEIFAEVNNVIYGSSVFSFSFDHEKIIKFLNETEENIHRESTSDFMFGGL